MDYSINKIFKLLFEKIWIIVLITVLCGVFTYTVSRFFIKPKYESKATFMVGATSAEGVTDELAYAKTKVSYYIELTQSQIFLEIISQQLNTLPDYAGVKEFTYKDIEDLITTESGTDKGAAVFYVTIRASAPELAYNICNTIAAVWPDRYEEFELLNRSRIQCIYFPEEGGNLNPVSPNIMLNTMLGLILGAVIAIFLILIIDRLDNSIKDEFDLVENYDIPLIGVVYTHKFNKTGGAGVAK